MIWLLSTLFQHIIIILLETLNTNAYLLMINTLTIKSNKSNNILQSIFELRYNNVKK